MPTAIAFISWGQWVADCPMPTCHNARIVRPGDTEYVCLPPPPDGGCGLTSALSWPADVSAAMAALAGKAPENQSETVPGSPQESMPDTSGDTGVYADHLPQPDDGNPDSWRPDEPQVSV